MSWEATSGLTPVGAQQDRGRFIRPKRASSANITRDRRPLAAAARRPRLTAFRNPFFYRLLALLDSVQDGRDAASTCAIHCEPTYHKPCCCLSGARSPFRGLISIRGHLLAPRPQQLWQIYQEWPSLLPRSCFPAVVHQSASALTR